MFRRICQKHGISLKINSATDTLIIICRKCSEQRFLTTILEYHSRQHLSTPSKQSQIIHTAESAQNIGKSENNEFNITVKESFTYINLCDLFTLREKCSYLEFIWSVFFHIWAEYGELLRISPYSVRMQENTDHKNP